MSEQDETGEYDVPSGSDVTPVEDLEGAPAGIVGGSAVSGGDDFLAPGGGGNDDADVDLGQDQYRS